MKEARSQLVARLAEIFAGIPNDLPADDVQAFRRCALTSQLACMAVELQHKQKDAGSPISISAAMAKVTRSALKPTDKTANFGESVVTFETDLESDELFAEVDRVIANKEAEDLTATELSGRIDSYQRAARLNGKPVSFSEAARRVLNGMS